MRYKFNITGEIKANYNLSHLSWFRVGGAATIFFKPYDLQDLAMFIKQNMRRRRRRLPIVVIGAGSNIIIRDGGIDGVVIKLGTNFTNITLTGDKLIVGGGCLNANLAKFCLNHAITGFEFLIGIPGTIGGSVVMNAGAYGRELKDIVTEIEVVDADGRILTLPASAIGFRYRGTNLPTEYIVTKASFAINYSDIKAIKASMLAINQQRLSTQPITTKTGGSTFTNPEHHKAWQLIDKAGLRGYRIGDASLSQLHCNFIINHGSATAKELEDLGELVRARVLANSGITLEWEIKRLGQHG